MKKIIYLECPTGISGDMCLGALVDLGVPLQYLKEKLTSLGLEQEYQLREEKVHRNSQIATKIHVDLLQHNHHHHDDSKQDSHHHPSVRHLPEIEKLIEDASFSPRVKEWSLKIFRQLAIAEGAVHGITPEKVHFHEVGATDAIVDIVGTCLGLDYLEIDRLYCSAMPTGGGTIKAAHGRLPVPAPAVLKLWELANVPVYSNGIDKELVTPTGAAIATTLATGFGAAPAMKIKRIGLGAGSANLPIPNILRLWLGEETNEGESLHLSHSHDQETISVLETQLDDLSPQAIGYTFEQLLKVGALDVFTSAIGMKKSRSGILLTVICPPEKVDVCEQILFTETTTLGIRHLLQQRSILQREIQPVETNYGTVRIKIGSQGTNPKKVLNVQPEYEDCAQLARKFDRPLIEIHRLALDTWYQNNS